MKKLIAMCLMIALTGCGTTIEADTLIQPPTPTPRAELYIRETIVPEEVENETSIPEEVEAVEETETETTPEHDDDETPDAGETGLDEGDRGLEDEAGESTDPEPIEEPETDETEAVEETVEETEETPQNEAEPSMRLYGTCTLTFYCSCSKCCGAWSGSPTASGVMPTPNHTVACDLPFGTRLMIEGQEYVVEDRGVSGMWVDIFVSSHDEALQRGMYQADVFIIE